MTAHKGSPMSLLDYLAYQTGCLISDLRYLKQWEAARVSMIIENIPPGVATLLEWNDALVYLTASAPESSVEAAREKLITALKSGGIEQLEDVM